MIRDVKWKKGHAMVVDPGKNLGGVAAFRDGVLVGAGAVESKRGTEDHVAWEAFAEAAFCTWARLTQGGPTHPNWAFIERMVIRTPRPGAKKANPEDLIQVQGSACWLAGKLAEKGTQVFLHKPEAIRGQLPKHVAKSRALGALTAAEKKTIEKADANLSEDIIDAVFNGLVYMRRL